ncbi:hypothetical protein [Mycobacterium sp.]|uniref:hypothetical protein n=1 Tax=Mycobacterium sp. TaxID=1785 RepID=UPI003D6A7272
MDLERITRRMRLAEGSHQPGKGKGCAMNAISYLNGDPEITDFPVCSARPLAAFVQWSNDLLAGPDGYLSPEDSVVALELAWQTMGTADVPDTVVHAWVAELLTDPTWGVLRYVEHAAAKAISDIAELHRKAASGDIVPIAAWDAADRAAHAAAREINSTLDAAALYALRAAYESAAPLGADYWTTLDAIAGNALRAHARVTDDPAGRGAGRAVDFARHAIRAWRYLAGLDGPQAINHTSIENALQRVWMSA